MIPKRSTSRCAGLTFIELLLSLSITAMIGLAIAAMLSALSYGTSQGKDMRSLVVKNKIISARITAAVREASTALELGADYIVLWRKDDNGNGIPNLGEIQYIEYNAVGDSIISYQADWSGMAQVDIDAANTGYQLTDDFEDSTVDDRGESYFPGSIWNTGISSWTVTANDADVQLATLISFRFDLTHQEMTDIVIGASGLRNK
jgi:hypothetical protein